MKSPIIDSKTGTHTALKIFQAASTRVPAYRDFLRKQGIKPNQVNTLADLAQVPPTDKQNYVSQYSLPELCWDGDLSVACQMPMSSGTSGQPYFWPTSLAQDEVSGLIFQSVLEDIFGTRKGRTLFVNSFGMGGWKAGLEFYGAVRWVAQKGSAITTISPGLDQAEVIRQLKPLLPYYDRVVLSGYPPFIKDILNFGAAQDIAWPELDLYMLTAGEAFSEVWRERVLELAGHPGQLKRAINLYGMAEVGALAHETPVTISLRQKLEADCQGELFEMVGAHRMAALYQFRPEWRHFETGPDETLLLTADAGLPLIRYNTKDRGGVIGFDEIFTTGSIPGDADKWRLPMVYLYGRQDLSVQIYAVNVYTENIKAALEHKAFGRVLSGIFVMETKFDRWLNQYIDIMVELAPGQTPSSVLTDKVKEAVVTKLLQVNSEFKKLHSSVGPKVAPRIKLVVNGKIGYVPGRKHKWVKRG